ncbi:MAG: chemotaxis-specific protein-glutamate methyltransferase CheB [Pontixanthobacter sp.]
MVVDDSLIVRTVLARIIGKEPDLDVVCTVSSAELALKQLNRTPVDVVVLDLEMPGIGGLGALPDILSCAPQVQVLVVSSLTADGTEHALTALSMGAADTLAKPHAGEFGDTYGATLVEKIRALGTSRTAREYARAAPPHPAQRQPSLRKPNHERPRLLAIGASTGGIHAMCTFLENLPQHFDLPVIITQHLPASFMPVFARQLELASSRAARVAIDGMLLEPGTLYIAPGDGHLTVRPAGKKLAIQITQTPAPSGCLPSVDPMLESLVRALDGKAVAIILSGMGRDGAIGAAKLAEAGGTIFAQDQDSAAVWGMPRAVAELGLASAILPPADLSKAVMRAAGAAAWK